jgi:hypothetical protein
MLPNNYLFATNKALNNIIQYKFFFTHDTVAKVRLKENNKNLQGQVQSLAGTVHRLEGVVESLQSNWEN